MIVIETPRLILRHLTLEDTEALASIYADPAVMKFVAGTLSLEETKEFIEKIINRYEQHGYGFGLWATIYKLDNQFIGRCGVKPLDNKCSELEMAYLLSKEYWGRGLATEAAIAIRDYGFEKVGCNRLISLIDHGNIASQKVALKTGLTYAKDVQMWGENVRLYAIYQQIK
ncbi:GNAT family N-acetyltransferase [Pleurocapsa sp. PCC 7319]|uniref:GNAT family N-acetyltransferase n=1 Tax=Pleurocapsa sp. PCC 7319 TaxID=118161 RepID=UPI0003481E46|nr:GNAT family N-acetyltransferase [Pleurocapsa sp. PCC 7319]